MTDGTHAPLHSAEYFGDSRDHWWNADFMALMGRRWGLDSVGEVLDVGCGVGHWGRTLAPILPPTARVTGVDREPAWVEQARERAKAHGLDGRYTFSVGRAEALPSADASFDLVTCQTVLIHVPDVRAVVAEMLRVLRPGGRLIVCEPSNQASSMILDSVSYVEPADEVAARARFQLVCERGKERLGEGNNSVGVLVPGILKSMGLRDVSVYLSDKAVHIAPPYARPEEQAELRELSDWTTRDFWIWSRADTLRYLLAGGGSAGDFEALWSLAMRERLAVCTALTEGRYHAAGGGVVYLTSGRKP